MLGDETEEAVRTLLRSMKEIEAHAHASQLEDGRFAFDMPRFMDYTANLGGLLLLLTAEVRALQDRLATLEDSRQGDL